MIYFCCNCCWLLPQLYLGVVGGVWSVCGGCTVVYVRSLAFPLILRTKATGIPMLKVCKKC